MAVFRQLPRLQKHISRSLTYRLPEAPVLRSLLNSEAGFPGLYSQNALNDLWSKQGEQLTARLNHDISEMGVTNTPSDLSELVASTFNTPELQKITATASRLHNLQFCLESLRPADTLSVEFAKILQKEKPGVEALLATPSIDTKVENEPATGALRDWIVDSFGSIAEFRTLFLNSAKAVKGDGITWLVAEASYSEASLRTGAQADLSFSRLAVMNTYNAGLVDDAVRSGQLSKLKQQKAAREEAAARRKQERSEIEGGAAGASVEAESGVDSAENAPSSAANDVVLGTIEEAEEALLYSDRKLVPLVAVDASMRAYLEDYGVFGKQQYLDNVWRCIDWTVVEERAPGRFKPSVSFE